MPLQVSSASKSTSPSSVFEGALGRPGHPNQEVFYDISLPISRTSSDIEQCMDEFFCGDGNCEGTSIVKVPEVLVLDLKRFQFDQETKRTVKVHCLASRSSNELSFFVTNYAD
jgi:hypothetical protein